MTCLIRITLCRARTSTLVRAFSPDNTESNPSGRTGDGGWRQHLGFLACRIAPPPGLLFVDGPQDSLHYEEP